MTTDVAHRTPTAPGTVAAALAVVWTLVVLVGFSLLPFYSTSSGGESSDGTSFETTSEETIVEHEGTRVLTVLLVPVAAALVGLTGAAFRIPAVSVGAAGIAMALCLLGMASIGMFYLPAGVLLVAAAIRSADARSGTAEPPPVRAGNRQLAVLMALCLSWAIVGALVAWTAAGTVNDDAWPLVGAASVIGPASAVLAAVMLAKDHPRLAGLALLVSVVTPTYFAWILNVPPLVVGAGLIAVGRPTLSDSLLIGDEAPR